MLLSLVLRIQYYTPLPHRSNPPEGGTLTPETSQFEEGSRFKRYSLREVHFFQLSEARDQELQQTLLWTLTKLSQLFLQKNVTRNLNVEGEGTVKETIIKAGVKQITIAKQLLN